MMRGTAAHRPTSLGVDHHNSGNSTLYVLLFMGGCFLSVVVFMYGDETVSRHHRPMRGEGESLDPPPPTFRRQVVLTPPPARHKRRTARELEEGNSRRVGGEDMEEGEPVLL
eukprot:Hpha_TRINITY_DN32443_c0_g1::TRINITY_DN32443_c0_g1_i1::g.30891::m.30891